MARKTTCLNPKCLRKPRSRGLCNICYVRAHQLVSRGRTTWAALEKTGRVLPSSRGRGTTAWLLGRG